MNSKEKEEATIEAYRKHCLKKKEPENEEMKAKLQAIDIKLKNLYQHDLVEAHLRKQREKKPAAYKIELRVLKQKHKRWIDKGLNAK